ncbi:MAG: hypothetical protein A2064_09185 [Spirochaetes bacterium GWB1_66_5]|nr:MAG: hypothetical protein A2064_09185 [Spirochaetes bacterium GWB1_66_5]
MLRQEYFLGNLVLTGGAVAISVQTILLKRFVIRFGGLLPTFLTMLAGSLFLAAAVLATGGWRELGALRPAGWLLAVYIGLAGTAVVIAAVLLLQRAAGGEIPRDPVSE